MKFFEEKALKRRKTTFVNTRENKDSKNVEYVQLESFAKKLVDAAPGWNQEPVGVCPVPDCKGSDRQFNTRLSLRDHARSCEECPLHRCLWLMMATIEEMLSTGTSRGKASRSSQHRRIRKREAKARQREQKERTQGTA